MKNLPILSRTEDRRYISIASDGRKKKYRVRVGEFDSSFTRLETALKVRDAEARSAFRA
jgi:hypothetical protein